MALQILCFVERGAVRERPELSFLKGGTQPPFQKACPQFVPLKEAPPTQSRFVTAANLLRGSQTLHVLLLLTGVLCAGSNQSSS